MHGLNLNTHTPHALFINEDAARTTVTRLAFAAKSGLRARVTKRITKGAVKGWLVILIDKDRSHVITEGDVERFGL